MKRHSRSVAYVAECGVGVIVVAKACTACCVGWEAWPLAVHLRGCSARPFNASSLARGSIFFFFKFWADNRNRERKRRSGEREEEILTVVKVNKTFPREFQMKNAMTPMTATPRRRQPNN